MSATEAAALSLLSARAAEAVAFLWHEATVLDDKDYAAWLELWHPQGRYILPIEQGAVDHQACLNLVNDDDRMRRLRVERMTTGYSMSVLAAARTVRTLSRFTVLDESEDMVELRSAQVVVGFKRDEQHVLAADVRHRVVFGESGPKLVLKVVSLINSEGAVPAVGYLL